MRYPRRRQSDEVVVGEILDVLYGRIDGVEIKRHRVERGDRLRGEILAGLAPDAEQGTDPARSEIEIPGNQRLVHRRSAGELHPFGLDIEAERLALLFEQMLLLHDRQRHVGNAELAGDPHADALGIGPGSAPEADQRSPQQRAPPGASETWSPQSLPPTRFPWPCPRARFWPGGSVTL